MPLNGRRKKKLRLAFHFALSNPAGWECETCRRQGLEKRRRCGWLQGTDENERVVWARKGVVSGRCPVSEISAQSEAWVEMWPAWRYARPAEELSAKDAEAMALLSAEMEKEAQEHD